MVVRTRKIADFDNSPDGGWFRNSACRTIDSQSQPRARGSRAEKVERIARAFTVWAVGLVVGRGRYRMGQGRETQLFPAACSPSSLGARAPSTLPRAQRGRSIMSPSRGLGSSALLMGGWLFTSGGVEQVSGVELLVERFRELKRMFANSGPGDADRARLAVGELAARADLARSRAGPRRFHRAPWKKVLAHVHRHFAEPVDFEALAESERDELLPSSPGVSAPHRTRPRPLLDTRTVHSSVDPSPRHFPQHQDHRPFCGCQTRTHSAAFFAGP